ncbi:MAG TPA: sigma-70 family RNA polymerase sigma factor [Candidatus Limnocylindrales bacterium]|nr:sigma-70 family RNA polymerase sigma factor [Candidatus Limnocylindrales bacterium]
MTELDDHELLAEFARTESEAAFAALIARHVNLVYSAALRFTGNPHHAEEITQAVFIILARKAGSLRPGTVLSGWLYQTARLTTANFVKGEIRRQRCEQEAYMQSTLTETDAAAWEQIAPLLDEAMGRLGEADRNAIVLRFFENKTAQEVAATLKLNVAAAHKRVNRAVEKLRKFFTKRGVTLSATLIAGAVSANSVQAAPVGLALTISATAAKGAAIAATVTTLVQGTLKLMTYAKLKLAIGITAGILLAGGAATLAISQTSGDDKLTPQQIAKQAQDAYAALSSYSDTGTAVTEGGGLTQTTTFNIRLQRPNLYRIDWTGTGGLYTSKGVVWSQGNGDFIVMGAAGQEKSEEPIKKHDMQFALGAAGALSGSAASTIPAVFFKQNWGDELGIVASGRWQVKKEGDEKVGAVDCRVISSVIDPNKLPNQGKIPNNKGQIGTITTRLWIGKRDHLIYQTRKIMEGATIALTQQSDSDLKTILERQNKPATPEAIGELRAFLEKSTKLAQSALNSGKFVFTQTHENISVNQKFSAADFAR